MKMMKKMMITVWLVPLNRLCGHRSSQTGWSVRPPLIQPAAHWNDHTSSRAEVIWKVRSAVSQLEVCTGLICLQFWSSQRFKSYILPKFWSQHLIIYEETLALVLGGLCCTFHGVFLVHTCTWWNVSAFQRAPFVAAVNLSRFVVCSCGLFLNASMTDSTSLLEELRLGQRWDNVVSYTHIM